MLGRVCRHGHFRPAPLRLAGVSRRSSSSMFPEVDEETKKQKQRKQQILLERMRRSKLADAMRMDSEKVRPETDSPPPLSLFELGGPCCSCVFLQLFEAGDKPLAEQDSFAFPDTELEPLFGDLHALQSPSIHRLAQGSDVTLLTLSFNGIGKQQANAFTNAFLDVFNPPGRSVASESQTNIVDVHYYDGLVYSFLKRFLKNGLRKNTEAKEAQLKDFAYVKFERYVPNTEVRQTAKNVAVAPPPLLWLSIYGTQEFLFDAQVHNRAMGHAYLLDSESRVRWR